MDWQTPLSMLIVLVAVGDIIRRVWTNVSGRGEPGCGSGCSSCDSAGEPGPSFVPLGLEKQPATGNKAPTNTGK